MRVFSAFISFLIAIEIAFKDTNFGDSPLGQRSLAIRYLKVFMQHDGSIKLKMAAR